MTVALQLLSCLLRVTLDLRDLPDLRVRRAREDPLVSSVLLDLLVPVELE